MKTMIRSLFLTLALVAAHLSASAQEAEETISKLTERRWRSDGRASAFVEEGEG